MKVLLTTLNSKYIHSCLALYYLRNSLNDFKDKIDVELKEYTINNNVAEIMSDIFKLNPDVVAFTCYIWNIEETIRLKTLLKKVLPNVKIIFGGPEVSYDDFESAPSLFADVDYFVLGEGEENFRDLIISLLQNDEKYKLLQGVLWREKQLLQGDKTPQIIKELDKIPFPYSDSDFEDLKDKIIYYESSRGCPFSCSYCLSSATSGVRYFSIDRVIEDLKIFIKHNVKQVKFVDRTFNSKVDHYLPILQFLAVQDCRTNFHFEITASNWSEEAVEIFRKAPKGRFQFEIGVQSTYLPALNAINRHDNFAAVSQNVQLLKKFDNIHLHLDLIIGLPYETKDDFKNSFNDVYALNIDQLQIGFLKLLKGSNIRKDCAKHEYVFLDYAPYEVLANKYISYDEIRKLKILEKVFNLVYNSSNFKYSLNWLVLQEKSPFEFYEKLALFWEERDWQFVGHKAESVYYNLYLFCAEFYPQFLDVYMELLKFDALLYLKNNKRLQFLSWDKEYNSNENDSVAELKNSFYQDTEKIKKYIPNFNFTNWREVKKKYHVEVFSKDIVDFVLGVSKLSNFTSNEKLAVLFLYEDIEDVRFSIISPLDLNINV
ncbi:B12-binding domain-containing radical SAM protein [Selenomonadales bacterium OttesenSCG-928-I06]|nr:B12-binding domain-containing radical SAM protein [Selenomonadales bacterium OttesenSCG-928-I06]